MNSDDGPWIEIGRLLSLVLAAAFLTHYLILVLMLPLGGRPDFTSSSSLMTNVFVLAIFLLIAWLTRRLVLVTVCFVILGLVFIVPYLFTLKGTLLQALMQIVTYIGMPVIGAVSFALLGKLCNVPIARHRESG